MNQVTQPGQRLNGIIINQKVNYMNHALGSVENLIKFQVFDNFEEGYQFLENEIDDNPSINYILVYANNTAERIIYSSCYPFENVEHEILYCNSENIGLQILQKKGLES